MTWERETGRFEILHTTRCTYIAWEEGTWGESAGEGEIERFESRPHNPRAPHMRHARHGMGSGQASSKQRKSGGCAPAAADRAAAAAASALATEACSVATSLTLSAALRVASAASHAACSALCGSVQLLLLLFIFCKNTIQTWAREGTYLHTYLGR